jgi:hypothetical protein
MGFHAIIVMPLLPQWGQLHEEGGRGTEGDSGPCWRETTATTEAASTERQRR